MSGLATPTRRRTDLAVDLAVVVAYLGFAVVAHQFIVLERITIWYPPAGIAMAYATLRGWRALPTVAVAELLAQMLPFGALDDVGFPLLVVEAVAYAAVYTIAGRALALLGGSEPTVAWRRPLGILLIGALIAPATAALVRVAVQLIAGVGLDAPDRAVIILLLGDAVGAASIGVTIVTVVVRARRGGRWWAIPNLSTSVSMAAALVPALLVILIGSLFDTVVPFASIVLVPFLVLCVIGGVPAAGLAALPTSVAMTFVTHRSFTDDVLALTDLLVLQLLVIATGVFVATVVEERRELHLRLAEREGHLEDAQVQARAGSFRWDVIGDDVVWSFGLFQLLGMDVQPTDSWTYLRQVHPDDREPVVERLRLAKDRAEGYEATHRVSTVDGRPLVVRGVVSVREFDGRVVEIVGTISDITGEDGTRRRLEATIERERAAAEAERLARHVQAEAIAETEHAERVKEALLVAVSHEIRTPLTVVRGITETIRRPEMADRISPDSPMLERLDRNARRLERVLADLLDVDRIRRGLVEPDRKVSDLPALVANVVAGLDLAPTQLTIEIDEAVKRFPLDTGITSRIIEHLLRNVSRHAPGAPVTITARAVDDCLELRVDDRGPGIPPDERVRLRQAFRTGPGADHSPSTGVGLYLVDRFAALQGGVVTVAERAGGGTSIRVLLPGDGDTILHLGEG